MLTNDNEDSRRMIENCYRRTKVVINPIIDWEDSDVWNFIKAETIPYCSLYDEGFDRLGCIGCPMARQRGREREFLRWPKYKQAYLRAFKKMLEEREKKHRPFLHRLGKCTEVDVFNWWMEYDVLPGQINLFEDEIEEEDE